MPRAPNMPAVLGAIALLAGCEPDVYEDELGDGGEALGPSEAWGPAEQLALGTHPTSISGDPGSEESLRLRNDETCAACHDGARFAAGWLRSDSQPDSEPDSSSDAGDPHALHALGSCTTCHAGSPAVAPQRLHARERGGRVGDLPTTALGTGAVCVDCHRGVPGAPLHAPQADVLLGRGARLSTPARTPPHGLLADSCVQCHAAPWREPDPESLALGHTFRTSDWTGAHGTVRDACSACHGDVTPSSIGAGDWDRDGIAGSIAEEHERALDRAWTAVERRLERERVRGPRCARGGARTIARRVDRRDSLALRLLDEEGFTLGDCDRDGAIDGGERATPLDALPAVVRASIADLTMLERDGSQGIHNPRFSFAVLHAVETAL